MSTEILRPNAAGSETNLSKFPDSGYNYEKVNEETPDDTDYVYTSNATYIRDLYQLPSHTGQGKISSITVYFRCFKDSAATTYGAKPSIRTHSTTYDGDEVQPEVTANTYSQTWEKNPYTGNDWTWDEIDDLEAGISLKGDGSHWCFCTQLYVVVNYNKTVYEADTKDGKIEGTNSDYSTARTTPSTGGIDQDAQYIIVGQKNDSGMYTVYRGYLFFDTSDIPEGAIISSAKISLYVYLGYLDNHFDVQIQNGMPTYPHDVLESSDFNPNNFSGNGGTWNTSNYSAAQYYDIEMTAEGRSWIKKGTGAVTKFCLRSSRDINSVTPGNDEDEFIWFYSADHGSNPPKLTVSWSEFRTGVDGNQILVIRQKTFDALPSRLRVQKETYSSLDGVLEMRQAIASDLINKLSLRQFQSSSLLEKLQVSRSAYVNLSQSLFFRPYVDEGTLTSAQLLPPYSKDAIIFESNVTLNGGTVQVQFSDDNVNYYDANGTLNAWTTLSEGYNLLYITKANLSDKFYYKVKLTKGPSVTPYVDWIKVTYLVPYSASSNINQELNILGIGYADLLDILKIRKSTYSDLLASLIYEKFGSSSLPALLDIQKPSLADIYQALAVNETWKDITQMLNVQVAGYIDLSGLIDIYYKGISDLSNSLLLRTAGSTDLQNMFGIRRSTYQDMLNSLLLRTFGSTDLLESLTIEQQDAFALPIILDVRRSYFRWLLNQLSLRKSASANLPSTCWVRPYNELSSTATISRRGTIIIPHMLECRHSWWREINGRLVIPLYDGSVDFASSLLLRKRQVSFPKSILSIRRPSGYDISQTLEINKYKFTDIQGQTIVRKHTSADLSASLVTEHYAYLPCTLDVERGNISMLAGILDIKQTDSSEITNALTVASENYGDLISSLAISKQQYITLPCTVHVGRKILSLQNTIIVRKEDYSALPSIFTLRRLNQNDLLSELEIRSRIYNDIYNEMILRNQSSSDLVNQISIWSKSILDGQLMIERMLKKVSIKVEKPSIKIEVMKI